MCLFTYFIHERLPWGQNLSFIMSYPLLLWSFWRFFIFYRLQKKLLNREERSDTIRHMFGDCHGANLEKIERKIGVFGWNLRFSLALYFLKTLSFVAIYRHMSGGCLPFLLFSNFLVYILSLFQVFLLYYVYR